MLRTFCFLHHSHFLHPCLPTFTFVFTKEFPKNTKWPGNPAHYFELLKEEQVKLRFEMQRIEEENKKNIKKEMKSLKNKSFQR